MSLPAGQQRVLDGIAESLRASEPRLASMFSIFGRLCRNEGPPLRERLPHPGPLVRLGGMRHRLPRVRGRHAWQLAFVFGNMLAAVVIVSVLMALSVHSARPLRRAGTAAAAATG